MLKVWIVGAGGQIGRALNDVLDPMQIEALNTDVDELDITCLLYTSILLSIMQSRELSF